MAEVRSEEKARERERERQDSPAGRTGAPLTGAVAPAMYVVGRGEVVSGVVVIPMGMVPMVTLGVVAAEETATPVEAAPALEPAAAVVDAACLFSK